MPSLAVDSQGNVAIGYSTSGARRQFPEHRVLGRLASDPLNTLPQAESLAHRGSGFADSRLQFAVGRPCDRWGDYSAMSIDPVDDCTFWYANQYYDSQANGTIGNWQTRIGSFKFPGCTAPCDRDSYVRRVERATPTRARSRHPAAFGAAIVQTSNGGEIVVLDSAGYGPVVINKPVSIVAPPGVYAGVSVLGGTGIVVNAASARSRCAGSRSTRSAARPGSTSNPATRCTSTTSS